MACSCEFSSASVMRHAITRLTRRSSFPTKFCADTTARWHGLSQALMAGVAVLTRFQSCLKHHMTSR